MQFKTVMLATTSLMILGLAAAPASAKSGVTATATLGTGHTWQEQDDTSSSIDDEFMNIFGGAQINIPYSDTVNVQLDVNGDAAYANEDDDDNFGTQFTAVAHLNYSDDRGFLGIFGATGRTSSIDEDTASFFAAGFEGQYNGANWTAGGQIGWLDTCCDRDTDGLNGDFLHNAGFIRIDGAYYFSKWRAGAGLAYIDGEQDTTDGDAKLWEWSLFVERMIGGHTSAYLEYRGADAESNADTPDDEADSHTVNLGVRLHFNATDLYASNVEGPSAQSLRFGRWVSEAGEQVD
jgi:hypothetical protein